MKTPFYINPDALGRRGLSKYDVIMFVIFIGMFIWGACAYRLSDDGAFSVTARVGASLSYAGMLFGVFAHLAKQIMKADELAQSVLAKSIAQSGLFAVIFICGMALIERNGLMAPVFGKGNNSAEAWAVLAPVMFLWFAYSTARLLTCRYNKEG